MKSIRIALSLIEDGKDQGEFAVELFEVPKTWKHLREISTEFVGMTFHPEFKERRPGPRFRMFLL